MAMKMRLSLYEAVTSMTVAYTWQATLSFLALLPLYAVCAALHPDHGPNS